MPVPFLVGIPGLADSEIISSLVNFLSRLLMLVSSLLSEVSQKMQSKMHLAPWSLPSGAIAQKLEWMRLVREGSV